MKKLVLIILIVLIFCSTGLAQEPPVEPELVFDGEKLELEEPLRLEEGRLLVPARAVLECFGAEVSWDGGKGRVTGVMGDFRVDFFLDSKKILVQGEAHRGEAAARLVDGSFYVPLASLAEALGLLLEWQEETRTAILSIPEMFDPPEWESKEGPLLKVAYPPATSYHIYGSPLYVFGTTRAYQPAEVAVNGVPVDIWDPRTGNFLALVEVPRGKEFPLKVKATTPEGSAVVERTVIYPEIEKMPPTPLALHDAHLKPARDQILSPGATLKVLARGSPGAEAVFRIGEEGAGQEMTEEKAGIYVGTYTVDRRDVPAAGMSDFHSLTVTLHRNGKQVSRELPGRVAFGASPLKVVEVKEEAELKERGWLRLIREDTWQLFASTRGGSGYLTPAVDYLREGTRWEVAGIAGDYYRVKLPGEGTFLIHKEAAYEVLDRDRLVSSLPEVELLETEEKVSIRFKTTERLPFLIEDGRKQLELTLYGIQMEKNGTAAPPPYPEIIEDLKLRSFTRECTACSVLTVGLEQEIAGYQARWDGSELVFDIYKPPRVSEENPLQGKTIVIDPGHGGEDLGAIGPAAVHEKDAVLQISLLLRDMLEEEGAEVIMTRTTDKDPGLYERTTGLVEDADLFLSIHINAHAHGAPALETHGLMTLYRYAHSEKLAEIMLDRLEEETGLPAVGTWKRNLAVLRYSQLPALLVELGYLKHPRDNWHVLHPGEQERLAATLKEGLQEYFLSF